MSILPYLNNYLDETHERIDNPSTVTIKLFEHQKTIIQKMIEIENTRTIQLTYQLFGVIDKEGGNFYGRKLMDNLKLTPAQKYEEHIITINTNICILGDKVGAGKTYDILTLISINKVLDNHPIVLGGKPGVSYTCEKLILPFKDINTNLIIVPPKLINQWIDSLQYITNITYVAVNSKKTMEQLLVNGFQKYDVILITSTIYSSYSENFIIFRWMRIILDEPDTYTLPEIGDNYNFIWLISGTPTDLKSSSKKYLNSFLSKYVSGIYSNDMSYKNHMYLYDSLILQNSATYIDSQILLPPINKEYIICQLNRIVRMIHRFIPEEILTLIHADNIHGAIKQLNCNVETSDNIVQILTKNIMIDINNIELNIVYETNKIYHDENDRVKQLSGLNEKLNILKNKYNNITDILCNNNFCPICYDNITNKTILSCCKNPFCFPCITQSLSVKPICPLCRANITTSNIIVINNELHDELYDECKENKGEESTTIIIKNGYTINNNYNDKSKKNILIELLQANPQNKYIIFCDLPSTLNDLNNLFNSSNIIFFEIKGSMKTIQHKLDEFKTGDLNILLLNSSNYGAGLNLQAATDIIIYHKLSSVMENQVIGRAQRYGRTTPLNVHYLAYSNEYDI